MTNQTKPLRQPPRSQVGVIPSINKMPDAQTTAGDVLFYIPNFIGYLRVVLTLLSIILMICSPEHWVVAIACYVTSFVGDLFDGMAARKFDQCSTFGGLLDMVTDRCSTAGLLCVLSREYADEPTLALVSCCHVIIVLRLSSPHCNGFNH